MFVCLSVCTQELCFLFYSPMDYVPKGHDTFFFPSYYLLGVGLRGGEMEDIVLKFHFRMGPGFLGKTWPTMSENQL